MLAFDGCRMPTGKAARKIVAALCEHDVDSITGFLTGAVEGLIATRGPVQDQPQAELREFLGNALRHALTVLELHSPNQKKLRRLVNHMDSYDWSAIKLRLMFRLINTTSPQANVE